MARALGVLAFAASCGAAGCGFPTYQFVPDDAASGSDATGDNGTSEAAADAPTTSPDAPQSDATTPTDASGSTDAFATDAPADTTPPPIDARPSGPPPTTCTGGSSASACAYLPLAPTGLVVDGDGSDMCALAERKFQAKDPPVIDTSGYLPPETISVRAGVDAFGVRVFVQVIGDPAIVLGPNAGRRYDRGDAVEIYVRGHQPGPFDGNYGHDHAMAIVISPPNATTGPRAAIFMNDNPVGDFTTGQFAAIQTDDGYQVEALIPWSMLPTEPASGDSIGFDVGVDIADDPVAGGRQARVAMAASSGLASSPCGAASQAPWCDDRTFCLTNTYVP